MIKKLAEVFNQNEDFLLLEHLSDEIAYRIVEEDRGLEVLKAAEKKVEYFKSKSKHNA